MLTGEAGTGGAFTVDTSGAQRRHRPRSPRSRRPPTPTSSSTAWTISADGNQLEDVISGLTLDLCGADARHRPSASSVTTDAEGSRNRSRRSSTPTTTRSFHETGLATDGKLEGNATARSVIDRMQNVMAASHSGGGAFSILAQVGIERQQGTGALKFDEAKFADAIATNYTSVRDLFIERDTNLGKAALIDTAVDDLTDSIDGLFKIGTDSLNRRIDNIDNTIERYERSIENYRTTLERKFLAMENAGRCSRPRATRSAPCSSLS